MIAVVSTGSTTAAPELVEGTRDTGGKYGRTPQVMPRKRKWNESIRDGNGTSTYFGA